MADTVKLREALEAARRIVAYWAQRGIHDPLQSVGARNLDELVVARALLASAKELGEGDSTLRVQENATPHWGKTRDGGQQ